MSDFANLVEASALAQHLKSARWTYPMVNAGHVLGIALLVGSVVPMAVTRLRGGPNLVPWLRPYAVVGLLLAVACGSLLFVTQAAEYLQSLWFGAKMVLLAVAVTHAVWMMDRPLKRTAAALTLLLWLAVLLCGRMIAYG